ncbi:MAG: hypothetical protein GC168_01275 [Candidatus Hydrogenedens sp.]|nr:hypothetical protein [Candidatus Hydrogenedens sp.]
MRLRSLPLSLLVLVCLSPQAIALTVQVLSPGDGFCGKEQTVALRVLGAEALASFGVDIVYNRAQYEFLGSRRGPATRSWLLADTNELSRGVISAGGTAFFGAPISGDATVLQLRFRSVCENAECRSNLLLRNATAGTAGALLAPGDVACDVDGPTEGEKDDAPIVLCQDIVAVLEPNFPFATIETRDIDAGSSDDRGPVVLRVEPSTFTCDDVGARTVTLRGTDNSGRVSTCTAQVTVIDEPDPLLPTCRNVDLYLDEHGEASLLPIALGSTRFDCSAEVSLSKERFTCEDIGRNTVSLIAVNQGGEPEICTATVTVYDPLGACLPPPATYRLEVRRTGDGQVTVETAPNADNERSYLPGTRVTVRQAASMGWVFAGWQGDVSDAQWSDASITVTMDQAKSVTAVFEPEPIIEEGRCGCITNGEDPISRLGDWILAGANFAAVLAAGTWQRRIGR